MSKRVKVYVLLVLCMVALGPVGILPTSDLHTPTVTAPAPLAPDGLTLPSGVLLSPLAGVAIKVKDIGSVTAKFKQRAAQAAPDYGTGVANAGADWEAGSVAAEDNYGAATTAAIADKRYGRGVRGSAGKYQKNASTLGPQRYQTGIANAGDAYAAGMQPVLQTLASINLPARNVTGNNQERANLVAQRLRAMKLGKAS